MVDEAKEVDEDEEDRDEDADVATEDEVDLDTVESFIFLRLLLGLAAVFEEAEVAVCFPCWVYEEATPLANGEGVAAGTVAETTVVVRTVAGLLCFAGIVDNLMLLI